MTEYRKIQRQQNSLYVNVPPNIAAELNLKPKDNVTVEVKGKQIIIEKVK